MLIAWVKRRLVTLESPKLFFLVAILLVISVAIPDPLPFVDELLLLALTTWFGSRQRRERNSADSQESV